MTKELDFDAIKAAAESHRADMTRFLRAMISHPSESCEEGEVVACIKAEMENLGYDEVKVDGLGNVMGFMGEGDKIIAIDSHIDTVGIGNIENWDADPYEGYETDEIIYGRGGSDQEGGMASATYAAKMMKDMGLIPEGYKIMVVGTVQEEDCDGMCWQYIYNKDGIKPEFVISTEPTDGGIYRGHRGRMEIRVDVHGTSCHGSAPDRGDNAIYKMADIIADVRARGDEALKEYALKFDGASIEELQVTQAEIDEAFANMDPYFLETLKEAAANIEAFHRQQVHKNFVMNDKPGIVLGQKYTPIEKAGVYVPGGTAAYPSTVLMDVIPAKVAGVSEIVMTTPAGKDGRVNPVILAAAATAGVTKIFKTGGAQAVAALAYGTQSIPAVDKIVGPGNIYVATAKRKVFGKVGIDMIAGPSEILVLADGGCNPAWVAADLLSQAEHDKLASPVLVTDSPELAKAVQAELEVQIPQLPRAAIARASVDDNGKIIVCTDLHKAIEACNIIAPEHLEVCVEDPFGVLNEIKNAGSIFLGKNVPEALGDYFAGPNHTLPTSGTARFSSPLGVDDFVKKSSFIYYTREALGEVQGRIANFAEHEGLHAHARSVTIRFEE